MTGMDARDPELKKELNATLQARRELGEEYESALVDSFLEKVDQRIDGAVDRRLRRQLAEQQMVTARGARSPKPTDSFGERFGFGIVGVNAFQALRVHPDLFRGRRAKPSSQSSDWEG
jgi:hypothetical protein